MIRSLVFLSGVFFFFFFLMGVGEFLKLQKGPNTTIILRVNYDYQNARTKLSKCYRKMTQNLMYIKLK